MNEDALKIFVYFLSSYVSDIIVVVYFAYLLPFRLQYKRFLALPLLAMYVLFALVFIINGNQIDNGILNFFVNIITLLIPLCFFKDVKRGFLYVLILEVLLLLSDGLSYCITMFIAYSNAKMPSDPPYNLLGQLLNLILLYTLVFFIARKLKKIQQMDIPKSYWFLLLLTPSVSVYLLYYIFTIFDQSRIMLGSTLGCIIALLAITVGSTIFCNDIVNYFNIQFENQKLLLRSEINSQKEANKSVSHNAILRTQHNLKNQLVPIQTAFDNGEVQTVRKLINEILGDISNQYIVCDTGIKYIDDMVNYKAEIARNSNITIHVENEIGCFPEIQAWEFSVAIGIALDNSIEACLNNGSRKDIYIDFLCQAGVFSVSIENDLVEELRKNKQGDILTTKGDDGKHGLGLKSIRSILDRCGGRLFIDDIDNKFSLRIVCIIGKI